MATGRPRRRGRGALVFVVVVLILAVAGLALSGLFGGPTEALGATVSVVNSALDARKGGGSFEPAIDGDLLASGDQVRTDANGRGLLTFFDGSTIEVEPRAQLTVNEVSRGADGSVAIRVEQTLGRAWVNVQKFTNPNSRFEVKTPSQTAIVRGTAFEIVVEEDGTTTVKTAAGELLVEAQGVRQTVREGDETTTRPGAPPPPPVRSPPTPGLRITTPPGVGVTVRDPRGLVCREGRFEIPGCRSGSLVITNAVPGTYALLMTASASLAAAVTVEGTHGDEVVAKVGAERRVERGDLVQTTFDLEVGGDGRPKVGALKPFALLASVCGLDAAGLTTFASGTPEERIAAADKHAVANPGGRLGIVIDQVEVAGAIERGLAQLKDLPATVREVKVTITGKGLAATANVGVKLGGVEITRPGRIRIIAGPQGMKVAEMEVAGVPAPIIDQLRGRIDRNLAGFHKRIQDIMDTDRAAWRDGCVSWSGKAKKR